MKRYFLSTYYHPFSGGCCITLPPKGGADNISEKLKDTTN
jgi:hypothetical protein